MIAIDDLQRGRYRLYCDGSPELLFTENETNFERLYGVPNRTPFVKDGFDRYVVHGDAGAINPGRRGTKAAARYRATIAPGATFEVTSAPRGGRARAPACERGLRHTPPRGRRVLCAHRPGFALGRRQAGHAPGPRRAALVEAVLPLRRPRLARGRSRQPAAPRRAQERAQRDWGHVYNADVLSMPDKWEYPWYAAWDLAFHCVPLALVDSEFAKEQLVLLLREWYMHPNGQIPAYEWALGDVNPPVHAWAAWRVYKIEKKRKGRGDRAFLVRVFHKLMLNFTWWVNRKDAEGNNIFQGGFLGLDNIGVFDRSAPLPTGGTIEQSDGTSWMAMFCLNMLAIALELASEDPAYEDVASKFWEHFVYVAHAINTLGVWHSKDGFYYDVLNLPDGRRMPLTVRSMVGLIPLFAVETLDPELLDRLPSFKRRLEWFIDNRPDLVGGFACMRREGQKGRRIISIVNDERLKSVLGYMLDEKEFLSPFGVRALSRIHREQPYTLAVDGMVHRVDYEPGESSSGLFGGNSNWRGPIWFPVNFLLVEALQKFHHYWGDDLKVEMPSGSGRALALDEVAAEISRRLVRIFLRDDAGRRPVFGRFEKLHSDPEFSSLIPFHEYFHGDDGSGVGARAQTGWTGLVAKLLQQSGE